MFKALAATTLTSNMFPAIKITKCAEIYYDTTEFTIKCICDVTALDYDDFLLHFRSQHLRSDIQRLATNRKSRLESSQENVNIDDDPLHCHGTGNSSNLPLIDGDLFPNIKETDSFATELECLKEPEIININKQTVQAASGYGKSNEEVDWSKPYNPTMLRGRSKRPYKPRNKPNMCNYCGRTFRRRYQLDTHLNIHTGLKPHQCDVCGRQFRAVTTLTRHLATHEQRESFRCKHCEKDFTHRAALVSHELRHTQQRNVPCGQCGKLFYTSNQLDTHKRKVHHSALDGSISKPLPYACDICSKSYRSASMLSTHKYKKHLKMAKFNCENCDKKFVDEVRLRMHKAIHVHNRQQLELQAQ